MKTIIYIMLTLFIISILIVCLYVIYMGTKKQQYPEIDFSRFEDVKSNVADVEKLINKAVKGVNGWMWLAMAFMALHYFMNFWSIVFMILNIVVVTYETENNKEMLLFLVSCSLLFTCLDLWINSKEKSNTFHEQWFKTSAITKKYIVKFAEAKTFNELCKYAEEYNDSIYEKNKMVKFL